jgi:transcriptional regulator with XRE-family HTH domain
METQAVIPDPANKTFGEVVRIGREHSNYSLRQLATITGVSLAQLSRIENGESFADITSASRILEAVGLSSGWLMRAVLEQSAHHSSLTLAEFQDVLNAPNTHDLARVSS